MDSLFLDIGVYSRVYDYCEVNGKHGECRELEELIGTHTVTSCTYAMFIIGERFKLGEEVIASDEWHSYFYARYVIGGRFELSEEVIASNSRCQKEYQKFLESL